MKTRIPVLTSILLLAQVSTLPAQVRQEWVARYDGAAHLDDNARAIAVDGTGNVYVTGESCLRLDPKSGECAASEYVTIKYGPAGNQVWVARYQGTGNGTDSGAAIAVDSGGNVYVTGGSWGADSLSDYATIKYDSSGNQVWLARYDGPASGNDRATALVLDADANVYVTGESQGDGTDFDYATIKYSSTGQQLWVTRYNGPANAYDSAVAIVLDAGGNPLVTGASMGAGGNLDYATVRYSADGTQLWVSRFAGPGNVDNIPAALALDGDGNVYVTGGSANALAELSDFATVKYDSLGNQRWAAPFHRDDHREDSATAIAVGAAGNAHVAGKSIGDGTNHDYVSIKYDPAGAQLWAAIYDGPHH